MLAAMSDYRRLSSRAVLSVTGPDAESFLQGIITQNVAAAQPAAFSALLTPQGKVLFDFILVRVAGGFLIDTAAERAAALEKRIKLYKLRAKVEIAARDNLAVVWTPDAPTEAPADAAAVFADPRLPVLGWRAVVPNETASGDGEDAYHAARRAAGVPEFGVSFDAEETFPLDVNYDVLNGVDYRKGCFVGQEVASRMKRKGEVRKRTMVVAFGASANVVRGADLKQGEATVGVLIEPPRGQASDGLAIVRLDRISLAAPVDVDGASATASRPAYLGD
ncbi:MAG: folate-binding protein [Alphaproteobacteria bacterium]|nr:folate-binding protein [Alphaproteobacteria bacterium]